MFVVIQHTAFQEFFYGRGKEVSDSFFLIFLLLFLYLLVGAMTLAMLSPKHQDFARGAISFALSVDLVLLIAFGFMAVADSQATEWTPELVLILFLLLRYLIKLVILFVYFVLGRLGLYGSRAYIAINKRMTSSIGRYHMARWEIGVSVVACIGMMLYMSTTQFNAATQFLIAFSVVNVLSFVLQSVRETIVLK